MRRALAAAVPEAPPTAQPQGEPPVAPPAVSGEPEYIDAGAAFDWGTVPPEESGIPPTAEDELDTYSYLLRKTGMEGDEYVQNSLYTGWFDLGETSDRRVAARQAFFDFLGWDEYDFDWDEWRDWYSDTAA